MQSMDRIRRMVEAASGIYGQGVRTGLTMGDLRALHAAVQPGEG